MRYYPPTEARIFQTEFLIKNAMHNQSILGFVSSAKKP